MSQFRNSLHHILYISARERDDCYQFITSFLTKNTQPNYKFIKMFKFVALFLVASAISSSIAAPLDPLVIAKQTELSGKITAITANAQKNLKAQQDIENAKVALLKAKIVAAGKSTATCKTVEDALEVERLAEIKGLNDLSAAKQAVLKTTTTIPTLNTFETTLPGFKTQLDNSNAAYKPVYILAAAKVTACYNGVLAAPK